LLVNAITKHEQLDMTLGVHPSCHFLIAAAVGNTQFVMEFVYFNFNEFYCDGTSFLNFMLEELSR